LNVTITATSTVAAVVTDELGREYLALLASAAVGALIGGYFSDLLSNRRQRKRIMSERVYQPLLYQAGLIAEKVRDGMMPDLIGLEAVRHDSLFRYREDKVQTATLSLIMYTRMYREYYPAARDSVKRIIREEIESLASSRQEDLAKWRSGGYEVSYRAFIGHEPIGIADLESCLLIGRTPAQFLLERHNILQGHPSAKIDANISGHSVEKTFADTLSQSSLKKADNDETVQIFRHLAIEIVKEPDNLAGILKKRVF